MTKYTTATIRDEKVSFVEAYAFTKKALIDTFAKIDQVPDNKLDDLIDFVIKYRDTILGDQFDTTLNEYARDINWYATRDGEIRNLEPIDFATFLRDVAYYELLAEKARRFVPLTKEASRKKKHNHGFTA